MIDPMPRQDATLPPREPEATTIATLTAQLAEARAELARLREGLESIADSIGDHGDDITYFPTLHEHNLSGKAYQIGKDARALLEGSKP